jgi:glycosyltransferase involved in cell wall biosynthesis
MKIAYVCSGVTVDERRYLKKMVEKAHKPYLISFWNLGVDFKMKGVEFYHYRPRYFSTLKKIIYLKRLLKKIQPDVVHTGFLQTHGLIGAFVRDFPVLSMPMGSDVLILPQKSLYHKIVAKFVLKHARMITCDCEAVKNKIVEMTGYDPGKIIVIPCGTELNIFHPRDSRMRQKLGWQNCEVLIMTRQFAPVYGIEYFINALPRIVEKFPDVRAILVGSGPLEEEIKKRVDSLKLKNYIHFTGFVDADTVAECLNTADVYVSTSLSDGTSVSLLEALACRLPVVVSDVPANLEWIEDGVNGFVVPRKDSLVLADRIIELLNNPSLRQKMGDINYDIARKRADWDANFDKIEVIYNTLSRKG